MYERNTCERLPGTITFKPLEIPTTSLTGHAELCMPLTEHAHYSSQLPYYQLGMLSTVPYTRVHQQINVQRTGDSLNHTYTHTQSILDQFGEVSEVEHPRLVSIGT